MGYIEDFQRDLIDRLKHANADLESAEQIMKWTSDKVVESYRNGLVDGKKKLDGTRPPKRTFGQAR
jgi:hypothetical protein